jgi:drug/metabolite transporter (DMT)-like permease
MTLSGELKIILGAALFALIPVCVVYGSDMSVFGLLFGRLLLASLLLFIVDKNRFNLFKIKRKESFKLFLWSQLMLGAMLSFFFAIKLSSIAVSSALLGTQPVIVVILAIFLMKEKLSVRNFIAAVITLIGIFLITGLEEVTNSDYLLGELLAICSSVLLALNFILQKKYLGAYSGQELVFYSGLSQLPFLLPFVIIYPGQITLESSVSIVVLAVLCTVLAYSLIYNGVKEVAVQKIGVLQSVEYILPILMGIFFFHEMPTLPILTGMIIIIFACLLVGLKPEPKKKNA